ncbi:hypothetical protein BFV94_2636 [Alteromonas macleodii]|uniref:Uncharacterized protein n=1 Tax=Alteromonas macleodii TaxID=28108 RepID=A0AB36FQB7_ALTMA|nr:hypothetical protein BFV94_2636 [Alteromonas macleodii]OES30690.1 hypothetical protein BFV93_2628 [Alteromonas macleodii]OES30721.1 hypothetical protein BFV95_2637 [Alteromonas macleodii]OES40761.1 hypothetical protein BFV96_2623 [Alteromonas macleodii]
MNTRDYALLVKGSLSSTLSHKRGFHHATTKQQSDKSSSKNDINERIVRFGDGRLFN